MLELSPSDWPTLDAGLSLEWLVTNGLGSYGSGTVLGPRTRRYHGLLVAALQPPVARHVLLASVEDEVQRGPNSYRLSANEYHDGTIHPRGHDLLARFWLEEGVPSWEYDCGGPIVRKRVWMEHGQQTTYVRYELLDSQRPARLLLSPLCAYRNYHDRQQGHPDWRFVTRSLAGTAASEAGIEVEAYPGAVRWRILVSVSAVVAPLDVWYWRFCLREERARGLDHLEDLYCPGTLGCDLVPGHPAVVAATLERPELVDLSDGALERALGRGRALAAGASDDFTSQLRRAADQFVVARPSSDSPLQLGERGPADKASGTSILAGYHWFTDWGRDAMIALPGLLLTTGRHAEARDVLTTFARYVDQGMLPNRFPDAGQAPEYNTADATLWFCEAVHRYVEETNDQSLVPKLMPVLLDIVRWHVLGTRHGIMVDAADGLLRAGEPGTQLTWMDAKVGDWIVTPRMGKPVELSALWYNAVRHMAQWCTLGGIEAEAARCASLARRAGDGLRRRFWCRATGYLYDVVDGPHGDDGTLRPNQIIAVALPHSALTPTQQAAVVNVVSEHLVTPRGLRTLAPGSPDYAGRYAGGPRDRDATYHQGTVWAWLLGPYVDAHLRVHRNPAAARAFVLPFRNQLREAGVGTISEIFDGDPPHVARGCVGQAWSVAEVLRAWTLLGGEGR